jgi:hypothetical protein
MVRNVSDLFRHVRQLASMLIAFIIDAVSYLGLCLRPRLALAAENLFLRKQLALYEERQVKPRRATHASRPQPSWITERSLTSPLASDLLSATEIRVDGS